MEKFDSPNIDSSFRLHPNWGNAGQWWGFGRLGAIARILEDKKPIKYERENRRAFET
jgi:uncharacterized protein with NRDE domain